tara:strand:- start:180 stop:419 length:240 start_codon:yes stop_codon:yes gene_type:complete
VTEVLEAEKFAEVDFGKLLIFRVKEGFDDEVNGPHLAQWLAGTFPDNHCILLPASVDMVKLWPVNEDANDMVQGERFRA